MDVKVTVPEREVEIKMPPIEVPAQEVILTIPATVVPSLAFTATLPAYTVTVAIPEEPPLPKWMRGVRVQAGSCSDAAECGKTLACMERAGANAVYYSVNTNTEYLGRLNFVGPEARRRGMQVYALLVGARLGWPSHPEWNARLNHPQVTDDWLDFTLLAAREYVANAAREIVTNYDVDGILLDRTRWSGSWIKKANLSADEISKTVQGVYDAVKAVRSDILVAASPSADHNFAVEWWGQRWHDWLDDGYVDYVTPMAYAPNEAALRRMLAEWDATGYFPGRIIPRLAVVWFDPTKPKTPAEMTGWIQICYGAGATGMTLWDARHLCRNSALVEALGAGGW